MNRCPCCKASLEIKVEQNIKDETLNPYLSEQDSFENYLLHCLHNYWRCRGEDNKKYRDEQYYYDPYHKHIEYEKETDSYIFCIQTYDSPEGDTWQKGKFKLKSGCKEPYIEITEHRATSSAFS